jgi:hypothetical protein
MLADHCFIHDLVPARLRRSVRKLALMPQPKLHNVIDAG